jgi:uncharacterized protein (TIGR03790 family)
MKRFWLLLAPLFLHAFLPADAQVRGVSYDDVMLIINDRSPHSVEIGNYFASRRNIPSDHICHIAVDTSETMDSVTFMPLKWQIQSWMQSHNLVDSINYIVTTKGCPLRVTTPTGDNTSVGTFGGLSSFEDCLVLINGSDSVEILSPRSLSSFPGSRYYNSAQHFKRSGTLQMYLVTRLDGYTVDQVKAYIQKAESPVVAGEGLWVLDIDPGRDNPNYGVANNWLRVASETLTSRKMNVLLDTTDTYLHNQTGVIGYASWGSNDGHSGGGEAAKPGNSWLNGSIAETYVSTGGRTFEKPGYGQSLIADWITEGVSGIKGYTDEPYLFSMAHPDILFDRYTNGFNMAESFYAASQVIAWRQVVIGDPKMRLAKLMETVASTDLGKGPRHAPLRDTIWVRNNSAEPVTVDTPQIDGDDPGSFQASLMDGKSFPQTVAAYDSLAIIVTFSPTRFTAEQATLHIPHKRSTDQGYFDLIVALSGTGTRPVLTVPDTVRFGTSAGTPVTRMVALQNMTPSDTVTITKLVISGTDAAQFALDNSVLLPHQLVGNQVWEIPVVYTASGDAGDTAKLTVTSNSTKTTQQVQLLGGAGTSGIATGAIALGPASSLLSISPNPLTSSSEIGYYIARDNARVTLEVIDLLGRHVTTLREGIEGAGEHRVKFDADGLPSGTYICRLTVATEAGEVERSVRSLLRSR